MRHIGIYGLKGSALFYSKLVDVCGRLSFIFSPSICKPETNFNFNLLPEPKMGKRTEAILEKHRKHLWSSHLLYYREPLPLDHGEGLHVWDVEGNRYLDFFGGILTTSVGHNHPKVVERVREQVGKLIHTSTLYPHQNHSDLGEKLAEITPGNLSTSYFTNSGTEADELALMTARAYTGNYDIIAMRHGYSGNSAVGKTLTAHSAWRFEANIVPGIKHAINPYCYRCPMKKNYPSCDVACAQDVEELIKSCTSGRVAGMLVEPIQGVGGFITPPPEYFSIVAEIIRDHGGLFISDEVQTGFGRTGGKWFGIEHSGVDPEIMTMAKGIANGFPMGCTITTEAISKELEGKGLLLSTFGGNPVSTVASLATIEALEEEGDPVHVASVGSRFRDGLEMLREKYQVIGDVRGRGLMQGLELVKDRSTREPAPEAVMELFEESKQRGLLLGKGGMYGNVVRISPSLTATEDHIDLALDLLDQSFSAMS